MSEKSMTLTAQSSKKNSKVAASRSALSGISSSSKLKKIPQEMAATASAEAKVASRWQGQLVGAHGDLIYGWAIDAEQTNSRVVLEILCNGQSFCTASANVAWPELPDFAQEDNCHGFVVELGFLAKQQRGKISVTVANHNAVLPGEVDLAALEAPARAGLNAVFSDGGFQLLGWVVDGENPQRHLQVQARLGEEVLVQSLANLEHPSLRSYLIGRHGFRLALPMRLADGQVHEIHVIDQDGRELAGSPIKFCHYLPTSIFGDEAAKLKMSGESATNSLLLALLDNYQKILPRSLALEYYQDWCQQYDVGDQLPPHFSPSSVPCFAVIVYGVLDSKNSVSISVLSLQAQLGVRCEILYAGADFTATLQQLRALAVDAISFLRAGDTLRKAALAHLWQALQTTTAVQVAYADSESALPGQEVQPWFKPAWDLEYAYASDFALELMACKAELLASVPEHLSLSLAEPSALAWQLLQAAAMQEQENLTSNQAACILHVPHVLYRFHSALRDDERTARYAAALRCLQQTEPTAQLQQLPQLMQYESAEISPRRLVRPLTSHPTVSLIIPTRDQAELLARCIASLQKHTAWPHLEIIVVDNDSSEKKTHSLFKKLAKQGVKIIPAPGVFNFSRLNNLAVASAQGEVIGLINNDIEALHDGWLSSMIAHLLRPNVAAVGAKLLWPNGMVQHGGVLLGVGHLAGHFGNLLAENDGGMHARNQVAQQVSAVTAACMLLRKEDYLAVGGLNERAFPVAFNDVDLCLKLRATGKAIIWCADAVLLHAESASRGQEDTPQKKARAQREINHLRQRWGMNLLHDPAYHPSYNLDAHGHPFSALALPPRSRQPRSAQLVVPVTTLGKMAQD